MREEKLGELLYRWGEDCFPLGGDSLALGEFARVHRGESVCDLGCGCGALGLLLFRQEKEITLYGVEISEEAAGFARENFARCGVQGEVIRGDLRRREDLPRPGSCHLVVSNPPYYPPGAGGTGSAARTEACCTVDQLCAAAAWCLKNGGRFALVYLPQRLPGLFQALRAHGMEPKRLQLLRHSRDHAPSAVLVESKKGGKEGLCILPDRWER